MTEKEKLENNLLYNPNYDTELLEEMKHAKDVCFSYNSLSPLEEEKRNSLLSSLFGKVGNKFHIESNFWCDYGYRIFIGDNFYMNHNGVILDGAKVTFGNDVFIGPNCGFYTAGHPISFLERNEGLEYAKPITVGNNVWIGGNVVVLPGVTIGDDVTIGAGSVVTKDIPSHCVAVGNPCKVIKNI